MPETRDFYSDTPLDQLKKVLGSGLHYHSGVFQSPRTPFEDAMKEAIRIMFPALRPGSSVADFGCGWGGPAELLTNERQCRVTAITNSSTQRDVLLARGINNVVEYDLNQGAPPLDRHDAALFMESLSHIDDKRGLLREARTVCNKLLLRAHCTLTEDPEGFAGFGGTMTLLRPDQLLVLLTETGWQIRKVRNIRKQTLPTLFHWRKNILDTIGPNPSDPLIATLLNFCESSIRNISWWSRNSPLLDIVAD